MWLNYLVKNSKRERVSRKKSHDKNWQIPHGLYEKTCVLDERKK
jgi:hypothetical protein